MPARPPTKKSPTKKAPAKKAPAKRKPIAKKAPTRPAAMLPMSEGDDGVQAYIASLPPWQAAFAKRLDALVTAQVPGVRKAIKWHSPMYGVHGQGFFLAFRGFRHHLKISFFKGAALTPAPPIVNLRTVRSLDVRAPDVLDEPQLARWIEQATSIPGWDGGSPRNGGEPL